METLRKDVVEECRQQVKSLSIAGNYRLTAEIIFQNGNRRYYRAKSLNKKVAISEILTFIQSIEMATGEKLMWRFKGEKMYHMSTNYEMPKKSLLNRIVSYFFE